MTVPYELTEKFNYLIANSHRFELKTEANGVNLVTSFHAVALRGSNDSKLDYDFCFVFELFFRKPSREYIYDKYQATALTTCKVDSFLIFKAIKYLELDAGAMISPQRLYVPPSYIHIPENTIIEGDRKIIL